MKSRLFVICCALLVLAGLLTGEARKYLSLDNPPQSIALLASSEVDYHRLYPELESQPTFVGTFYWWHHSWRPDVEVGAYWRPLSMQMWWLQFHTFGEDRSFNWMRISVFLTVLFEALLAWLVLLVTKSRIATLVALVCFSLPGAWIHLVWPFWTGGRVPVDLLLYQGWKDQPDLFCNCLTVGAMIAALRSRYWIAFVLACIAVCFKESGLLAFPLFLLVPMLRGEFRQIPRSLFSGIGVFLVAMMFMRYVSGPDVFHFRVHSSTEHWAPRYFGAILPAAFLNITFAGEALLGASAFALLLTQPKSLFVWFGLLLGSALVAVLVTALQTGRPIAEAFAMLAIDAPIPIFGIVLWLLIFWALLTRVELRRWAFLFAVSSWIATLPYARLSGALDHVLVLAKAFEGAYVGCAALAIYLVVAQFLQSRSFKALSFTERLSITEFFTGNAS